MRSARLLHDQELTRKSFEVGDVNAAQLEELARVRANREAQYDQEEARLLRAVTSTPVQTLRNLMIQWAKTMDDERAPTEPDTDRSWFQMSRTFGAYLATNGLFTPEDADRFEAIMHRAILVPAPDDTRKRSERQAETLLDVMSGETRTDAHIDVRVDFDVLAGAQPDLIDSLCETDPGGPVGRSMLETLLCDCHIGRVLMRGPSQVIDVGTQTRTVPAATRRALVMRDRHCRYPGCSRPHRMCDAHHIVAWEAGGPTNLDNLVLLCRRHHVHVHRKRLVITLEPSGTVGFRAPP